MVHFTGKIILREGKIYKLVYENMNKLTIIVSQIYIKIIIFLHFPL